MGAQPSSALAIAVVPFGPDTKQEELLLQLMAGAAEVLAQAGCALVGGHTGEGPEVSLGGWGQAGWVGGAQGWGGGGRRACAESMVVTQGSTSQSRLAFTSAVPLLPRCRELRPAMHPSLPLTQASASTGMRPAATCSPRAACSQGRRSS